MLPIASARVVLASHGTRAGASSNGGGGTPSQQHHHHHALHAHAHLAQLTAQHFVLTPRATAGGATGPAHMDPDHSTHSVLEIVQQPPESWYKDQFGRKATFDVVVRRVARGCAACADQRHLNVQLLYESGKLVENQNILRVASGLCLNKDDQSTLAIRIMEVSKNHQNQRFRLQISLPVCPLKQLGAGVAGVISEPVLVLSKKNKRPVKSDNEEAENKVVAKLKKSKHVMSPNKAARDGESPNASAFNTPTHRSRVRAESPPDFDGVGDTMNDEDQWGAEIVRFRNPTQGLCLWANAAFNFMHRLQWQTRVESPHEADAAVFQCLACHATYGSRPRHRSDCDLALLLEQTGSLDDSQEIEVNGTKHEKMSFQKALNGSPNNRASKSVARPPSGQPSVQDVTSNLNNGTTQHGTLGSTMSVDLLAKNLNLGSWEGYSSLSKIMFSLEAGIKQPPEVDPFTKAGNHEHKLSDASMNSLMAGGASWSFASPPQAGQLSLGLSSLLSSVKGLSPDTAAFLQEQDAALTGDASLLRSLSKVSLSDFLPDGSSDRVAASSDEDVRTAVTSLATVLADVSKVPISESVVMAIASVDFHNCGYPAFDASKTLVGSYFLSEQKSRHELRFLPNLYPLPPQMLHDLESNLAKWRQQPGVLLHARSDASPQSLEQLKARVIQALKKPVAA